MIQTKELRTQQFSLKLEYLDGKLNNGVLRTGKGKVILEPLHLVELSDWLRKELNSRENPYIPQSEKAHIQDDLTSRKASTEGLNIIDLSHQIKPTGKRLMPDGGN